MGRVVAAVAVLSLLALAPSAGADEMDWALAGEEIVSSEPAGDVVRLVATRHDGSGKRTLLEHARERDVRSEFTPDASSTHVAAVREDVGPCDQRGLRCGYRSTLFAGPAAGPFRTIQTCDRFARPIAVAVDRVAYPSCEETVSIWSIDDPGARPIEIPTPPGLRLEQIRAEGRYIAVRFGGQSPRLVVVDAVTGERVIDLGAWDEPSSLNDYETWDVQADGKLLVGWVDGRGLARLSWTSAAQPGAHDVRVGQPSELGFGAAVRFSGDRYVGARAIECQPDGGARRVVITSGLDGVATRVSDSGDETTFRNVEWDGRRAVWLGGEGFKVRDLEAQPARAPAPPQGCVQGASADFKHQIWPPSARDPLPSIAVRRGRVRVPVRCFPEVDRTQQTRCRGWLRLTHRRRPRVVIAERAASVDADGGNATIRLSARGRRLLARARRLPVTIRYSPHRGAAGPEVSTTLRR
jgi:hypothetical protein